MYNKTIHRLVAYAFLPKEEGKDFVNHKDGNKHNNCVDNLEWCTNEYNHEHATKTGLVAKGSAVGGSKLDEMSVCAIKRMLDDGISQTQIAKWFQVNRTTITHIAGNKTWKHTELTIK